MYSPPTPPAEGSGGDQGSAHQDAPFYAVVPLTWCEHLDDNVLPLPSENMNANAPCSLCGDLQENWICLHCYQVFCSRYVNAHMRHHREQHNHQIALSLADLSVWCFACDFYVQNQITQPAKEAAYRSKFGEDFPGTGTSVIPPENGGIN